MQEPYEGHEQEEGKDGAHDATEPDLFLVTDEGCGYDVSHQEQIDYAVEDEVGERVFVFVEKIPPL